MKLTDFEKMSYIDEMPLNNYVYRGSPVTVKIYHDESNWITYQVAESTNQYRFAQEDKNNPQYVVEYGDWKSLD